MFFRVSGVESVKILAWAVVLVLWFPSRYLSESDFFFLYGGHQEGY